MSFAYESYRTHFYTLQQHFSLRWPGLSPAPRRCSPPVLCSELRRHSPLLCPGPLLCMAPASTLHCTGTLHFAALRLSFPLPALFSFRCDGTFLCAAPATPPCCTGATRSAPLDVNSALRRHSPSLVFGGLLRVALEHSHAPHSPSFCTSPALFTALHQPVPRVTQALPVLYQRRPLSCAHHCDSIALSCTILAPKHNSTPDLGNIYSARYFCFYIDFLALWLTLLLIQTPRS